jgi:hypothetical protein
VTIEDIEREIDALGIRDEVEREAAAFERLQRPVMVPGLGVVSALAAQMLANADEYWFNRHAGAPAGRCYMLGDSVVHLKPGCRCTRRRR